MKKALKSIFKEAAAAMIMVTVMLLLAAVMYGIGLTAFGIPASCAEGNSRYDVAVVNVNPDSSLNVRTSPDGRIINSLSRGADVVILARENGWALVTTKRDMVHGHLPLGWVCADYLETYRFVFAPKENSL